MYAVVGTLLTALAVLGFTIVVLATRKPNPPAWVGYTLTHEFVAIGTVSLGSFGIALVVQSIALLIKQPLTATATDVIFIALILVAFTFAWMRLRVRATLAEYARQKENATQASEPVPRPGLVPDSAGTSPGSGTATPEDPDSPTRPRTPRWSKKAA